MAAKKVVFTGKDCLTLVGLIILLLLLAILGSLYFFIIRPVEKLIVKKFCRKKEIPSVFTRNK